MISAIIENLKDFELDQKVKEIAILEAVEIFRKLDSELGKDWLYFYEWLIEDLERK